MDLRSVPGETTRGGQYCIDIKGCSSKSFGAINQDEDGLFHDMLTSQDIVECHPRNSEACINAVATLKPYWKEWRGLLDWINPE